MPDLSRRAVVRGIVQGVGFRWAARDAAIRLRIDGYVRNRPDGSVEAIFSGPEDVSDAFVSWLAKGPPTATVTSIEVDEAEAAGGPGFEIRP